MDTIWISLNGVHKLILKIRKGRDFTSFFCFFILGWFSIFLCGRA